ncbi:peptidase family C50-domain-containing protein [Nemania sp. NC0429]|nr:peptidase family C50-domain-containing protein [Nemania sp. NC0429]
MAPLTTQADAIDAIRSAITSVSTCTPAISASLKELLQGRQDNHDESSKPSVKSSRKPTQSSARIKSSATTTKRPAKGKGETCHSSSDMSSKEKAVLATQIVNATLKTLGDAAKISSQASDSARSPPQNDTTKPSRPTRLRRSASVPMTPLQPRALNRVDTTPATTKPSVPLSSTLPTGCLALVECARVAFATLRSLQASGAITLPDFQLESGMSSLVAKLITLKLFDHAAKELRILKRRLESIAAGNGDPKNGVPTKGVATTPKTLSDLLDYPVGHYSGPVLGFVITAQLQALRILYELSKTTHLGAVLPFLRPTNPTSPLTLLLSCVKGKKPENLKIAKQLESLSQILLSLTPSLASKNDSVALEPRLSPSPETSLEVQTLGLITRLESWSVSGHKGDVDKEIILPLSRCLAAFSRRSSPEHNSKLVGAFTQIWDKIQLLGFNVPATSKGSLAPIYQLLAKAFQDAGDSKEAKKWTSKWKSLVSPEEDSAAKCCAVAAQLLALSLQDSPEIDRNLVAQVLDGMQGPLSGSVTELEDLLVSLCLLRKVAFNTAVKEPTGNTEQGPEPESRRELCEKFIAQLPRFALRWLGKPAGSSSTTKDLLRFEQRRQLLSKHLRQILESALLLTKKQLDEDRFVWEAIDSMLQDSLVLLEYMGDLGQSSRSNPAASYHVKISHIYYQLHLTLRNSTAEGTQSTSLRALKRSIECVRQQSEQEQARAQLLKKWEAFVELCKASSRRDDAIDALRSIRDHLVRCDTVQAITASLARQSVRQSWRINAETELLSRTICNLAKLERRPIDWSWLLTAEDKATALEHDLHFILTNDNQMHHKVDISDPIVVNLLQLYSVEQYPIRRLRSLLILLTASIDSREQVEELRTEVELALKKVQDECLGLDTGLAHYAPYLCRSALCILSMASGELNSSEIKQAISAWKLMAAGCQSVNQLAEYIDDPQHLLHLLQSLADLARMKGLQSLLTEIVELSTIISQLTIDDNAESHIVQSANLCLHYVALGQSAKAEKIFEAVMDANMFASPHISSDIVSDFHLLIAEYYLAVGKFNNAERHLEDARKATVNPTSQTRRRKTQLNRKISMAHASHLTSSLYLERGENHRALRLAKTAVKILFHDWSQLEQCRSSSAEFSTGDLSQTDSSEEDASPDSSRMSDLDLARAHTGPAFWALAYPLYRFTCQLSLTYEHLGMYQETLYYAEKAQDIARSMGSSGYLAQATTHVASVSLMADKKIKSLELVTETRPALISSEPTCQAVAALCKAASVYQQTEEGKEAEFLTAAESMLHDLQKISLGEDIAGGDVTAESTRNPVKETAPPRSRGRGPNAAKPAASRKTAAKKTTVKGPTTSAKVAMQVREEDAQLKSLRASVLLSQSLSFIRQEDWAAAITALRSAAELSTLSSDLSQEHLLLGISLMGQSLTQMGNHAIFSIIQDSTLSFPSVAMTARDKNPHGQLHTGRASPHKPRSTQHDTQGFVENLQDAQEHLLEAHSIATRNGNGFLVHQIAAALQKVVVLLSNTGSSTVLANHPAYATCSIELARNLTWRRERKANRCDTANDSKGAWPMVIDSPNHKRASLGFSSDMSRFQRDYVDIIPATWNVVSLSLNEFKNDLCVTKLKAGSSPFALRLPLDRASSRDANNEVFDFPQGRSELLELIGLINRTCHSAQDMSKKGAKSEWWAEREELDQRLKELLETIESTWLGGFKGIFSQHRKRPDLLSRFQKTFLAILEKHLPSRHRVRGRKAKQPTTKVNLDPRILELFIGLGDPCLPEADLDEPLTDLLYFVVDVLQFHGEANAYDELDFDTMVIDVSTALHAYHAAAKGAERDRKGTHTILILDKSLHVFPWESLPCLQGLAVSRVPSLDYLRRSILEAKASASHQDCTESDSDGSSNSATTSRKGHHVSINSGTYILNPSTDLTTTQATFGQALSSLPAAWGSIEARKPTEAEFQTALTEKDILLYFGHGSGSQYIRGRSIRQLDKCRAVALLMGCSSASLTHVGQFEPYGPIRDYMLVGSPAVVGTLWDVTDRDIDRFAGAVFEEWGLFPRGTFAEDARRGKGGKGKASAQRNKAKTTADGKHGSGGCSLVEAVAKARTEACRFKYLTAAAVCVYGIPVYIGK